jgi:oligoendopeptidase F
MHYYDIYPPLVNAELQFSVDEAKETSLAALEPFGEAYLDILERGFGERWMHVYPGPGKRSGAYMAGAAYDVHPYLLLNYNEDYESLSTFAHEWGHAVHSVLSTEAQPFSKSDYSTFTAEVASIINEVLLEDYMIEQASTDDEKLFYLGQVLESLRGTFFRQAMFAEFELAIHEEIEAGRPLSGARLTQIYGDLLKKYHGHDEGVVQIDDLYAVEWAYIPHFVNYDFYVYQYATSMAGGIYFATRILEGGEAEREEFLNVLRAGGSDYAYQILKEAGVDMATPAPYQALIARMNDVMDEIEVILDRRG